MRTKIYSIAVLILFATFTVWAGAAPKVIRLGWIGNKYDKPTFGGVIGYIQQKKAFEQEFAKEGIKIEWNFFKGVGPAINEALANGKLDIAFYGDLPSTAGKSGGLPTRVIIGQGAGSYGKNFILVNKNSTIKKLSDLKGKRITFPKGTALHLGWLRYTRDVLHLDGNKDFKVVSLGIGDQDVALTSGSVDAIFGGGLDLVHRGTARVLDTISAERYPTVNINAFSTVATQQFIDKYPDIVQRWVKVYLKNSEELYQEKNRDVINRLWASTGASLSSVLETMDNKNDIRYDNLPIFDEHYKLRVQRAIRDEQAFSLIRKPIDIDSWWDRRFYDKAFKELGLDVKWKDIIARRAQNASRFR